MSSSFYVMSIPFPTIFRQYKVIKKEISIFTHIFKTSLLPECGRRISLSISTFFLLFFSSTTKTLPFKKNTQVPVDNTKYITSLLQQLPLFFYFCLFLLFSKYLKIDRIFVCLFVFVYFSSSFSLAAFSFSSSCSFSSSSFSFLFLFLATIFNTTISTPSPFPRPPVSNSSFPF